MDRQYLLALRQARGVAIRRRAQSLIERGAYLVDGFPTYKHSIIYRTTAGGWLLPLMVRQVVVGAEGVDGCSQLGEMDRLDGGLRLTGRIQRIIVDCWRCPPTRRIRRGNQELAVTVAILFLWTVGDTVCRV